MSTELDDVIDFLSIAEKQGYLNDNTAQARRTACAKLFAVLEDDQQTVEYVRDHIDVIKTRFQNLNKEVRGGTIDEYARRVSLVINGYLSWKADRGAWEREAGARGTRAAPDGEKKAKSTTRGEKARAAPAAESAAPHNGNDVRVVKFPIRPDFDVSITLPRNGISMAELRRLAFFLLPYATDFDPGASPRGVFNMLEQNGSGEGLRG